MKKKVLFLTLFVWAFNSMAQTAKIDYEALDKKYAQQLSTLDDAVETLYNVISGPKGDDRNWELLRYLFHPQAKFITSGKKKDGSYGARYVDMDFYIENSGKWMLENGFFENELHRVTEQFGQIAHVFSTYECFNSEDDQKPFMRGINSIQFMNTGKRWAVMSIYFTQETPENPIPKKYLPAH